MALIGGKKFDTKQLASKSGFLNECEVSMTFGVSHSSSDIGF
jgi:hypothetical protein